MLVKLNINDTVKVKLTEHGKNLIKRRPEYYNWKLITDENGYSEWQLWHLFQTFEGHLGLGFTLPFETEIILIEK